MQWTNGVAGYGCNWPGDGSTIKGVVRCNNQGIHFEGENDRRYDVTFGWGDIAQLKIKDGLIKGVVVYPTPNSPAGREGIHSADLGFYTGATFLTTTAVWNLVNQERRLPTQEEFDAFKASADTSDKKGCLGSGIMLLGGLALSSYYIIDKIVA